jgi:CheY-like chemotaxis protein
MSGAQNLILLIDDDSVCNALNRAIIRKSGLVTDVRAFTNPEDALEFLTCEVLKGHYQRILVLLDINMPVMDGWEFVDRFRKIEYRKSDSYIYILTSSVDSSDKARAEADPEIIDFISKPISAGTLREISRLINVAV